MLEKGNYRARASGFGLGFSNNKGTPMASIEFTVSDGESTGDTITANLYFTENTEERNIKTLRLMGWGGTDVGDIQLDDLPNEVLLVVEEEEYNGRLWPRVKWINDPNRSGLQLGRQMTPSERANWSSQLRGVALKFAAGKPENHAPGPKRPAQPSVGKQAPSATPPSTEETHDQDYLNDDVMPF